jgi:hypothetical protein
MCGLYGPQNRPALPNRFRGSEWNGSASVSPCRKKGCRWLKHFFSTRRYPHRPEPAGVFSAGFWTPELVYGMTCLNQCRDPDRHVVVVTFSSASAPGSLALHGTRSRMVLWNGPLPSRLEGDFFGDFVRGNRAWPDYTPKCLTAALGKKNSSY